MPVIWYADSAVTADTTIISISVSVPVLSEQMRDTEPRVSTAGSRRMMALRCAMRCTPIASVIVMSAGKPFRDHRDRDADHRLEKLDEVHALHPLAIGEHQNAHDSDDGGDGVAELLDLAQQRRLERADAGEQLVDAAELRLAARSRRPRPVARPDTTMVPEKAMHVAVADGRIWRRPASVVLSAGTDSPVSAASSVRRFFTSARRRSAGTLSPNSSSTTSPGTSSSAGIMRVSPPRRVRASADSMLRIESSAFSALPSWMKPSSALRMTTPKMIEASSHKAQHQLGEAGAEQDVDQDVVELGQEPHERPSLLAFRQPVRTVLLQPGRGLTRIQAFLSLSVASRFTTSSAGIACQAIASLAVLVSATLFMVVLPLGLLPSH